MIRYLRAPWDGTVIVMAQSRFDKANGLLGCAAAEQLLLEAAPHAMLATPEENLQSNTGIKRIVYCGDQLSLARHSRRLDQTRGFVEPGYLGVPTVHTFHPQDACDIVSLEQEDREDEDALVDEYSSKNKGATARRNYRFWFLADVAKLYDNPAPLGQMVHSWVDLLSMERIIRQPSEVLYFDIETSVDDTQTLWCIGFALDNSPVYVIPVYDWKRKLYHGVHTHRILALFARLLQTKRVVAHNANFDLGFLWLFCGIPPAKRLEDTMVIHHRTLPSVEKSLAHCITYYLNAPYHKDTAGSFNPQSLGVYNKLLEYNAHDVHRTRAIHQRMTALGYLKLPQVQQGIKLHPLMLVAGLRGLKIDTAGMYVMTQRLKAQVKHATRVLRILIGYPINPQSADEVTTYCQRMGYELTEMTESGKLAMDASIMIKLYVRYKNPVFQALLWVKDKQKQLSMLDVELCQSL